MKIFEISANRLFITENMPTSATRQIASKCSNEAKETMPEVRICRILIEKITCVQEINSCKDINFFRKSNQVGKVYECKFLI